MYNFPAKLDFSKKNSYKRKKRWHGTVERGEIWRAIVAYKNETVKTLNQGGGTVNGFLSLGGGGG